MQLEVANIDVLKKELKWQPPEEFLVKADDGTTDLQGVLYIGTAGFETHSFSVDEARSRVGGKGQRIARDRSAQRF
jgi:hypothetical protein